MKLRIRPGQILSSLFRRFAPSAVLCLLLAVHSITTDTVILFDLRNRSSEWFSLTSRISSALALGLFFATAASCLSDRYGKYRFSGWIAAAAGTALGMLIYPLENADLLFGGLASCCLALCFHGVSRKDAPAVRLCRVCGWFLTVLGVSIVLCGALTLCASAFFALFLPGSSSRPDVLLNSIILPYLCFFGFAPWMFLGGLPDEEVSSGKPSAFRKFIYLVLLPLYLILLAVLLVYVAKIAVTFTMPVGVMNSYGIAALTLFVCFHLTLTGEENRLARWFCRWGALLLVPIIAVQGIGVWMRVSAYGLTSARVLGLVWTALCIAVVLTALLRRRANWFFLAAAAVSLVFFSSPLNVNRIAFMNQEARLKSALTDAGMLTAQGEIAANPEASEETREIIFSSLDYLESEKAPAGSLTETLVAQLEQIGEVHGLSRYSNSAKEILFGFSEPETVATWTRRSYSFTGTATQNSLDTRGYVRAEWISFMQSADYSIAYTDYYIDADVAALTSQVEQCRATGESMHFEDPIPLVIYGETVDLAPLINGLKPSDQDVSLPSDELIFPSGRKLHLRKLQIVNYAADAGSLDDYISVTGWLMTPEAAEDHAKEELVPNESAALQTSP